MNFKKTYVPAKGYTPLCKIGECSLKKLEFGIIELDAGERLTYNTEDKETAFIMLEGHVNVEVNGEKWENIGNRMSVFENRKAESFYMPIEMDLTIEAIDHIKIVVSVTNILILLVTEINVAVTLKHNKCGFFITGRIINFITGIEFDNTEL